MTWPVLSYVEAKETYETLHLWTQVIGKIKLSKMPWINHSWHVTLFVTPVGLTTSLLPYANGFFQIDFDFIQHQLVITVEGGKSQSFPLLHLSVAEFYNRVMAALHKLGISAKINSIPNELEYPIPFQKDQVHCTYNTKQVEDFHKALLNVTQVLTIFRSMFSGKCSPVHFFWGSFDLAVTRFSGRTAPKHPGGVPHLPDRVVQEAYSHEVSSAGFWPGNELLPYAAFYSYSYPEPALFKEALVEPKEAFYHQALGEFILPYTAVQKATHPQETLLRFLQTTYEAAANNAPWNQKELEFHPPLF